MSYPNVISQIGLALGSAVILGQFLSLETYEPALFQNYALNGTSVYTNSTVFSNLIFLFAGIFTCLIKIVYRNTEDNMKFGLGLAFFGSILWFAGFLTLYFICKLPGNLTTFNQVQYYYQQLVFINAFMICLGGGLFFWQVLFWINVYQFNSIVYLVTSMATSIYILIILPFNLLSFSDAYLQTCLCGCVFFLLGFIALGFSCGKPEEETWQDKKEGVNKSFLHNLEISHRRGKTRFTLKPGNGTMYLLYIIALFDAFCFYAPYSIMQEYIFLRFSLGNVESLQYIFALGLGSGILLPLIFHGCNWHSFSIYTLMLLFQAVFMILWYVDSQSTPNFSLMASVSFFLGFSSLYLFFCGIYQILWMELDPSVSFQNSCLLILLLLRFLGGLVFETTIIDNTMGGIMNYSSVIGALLGCSITASGLSILHVLRIKCGQNKDSSPLQY